MTVCVSSLIRIKLIFIDVILSLTRTSRVGYLRDIRRLTVALSRARLGLYILGRRKVFESCFELRQAFEILLHRPDKLMLVTGELWPSKRILAEEEGKVVVGETQMESVEHLGQYVYEMTNAKVQQLRAERGLPETALTAAPMEDIQEEVGYVQGEEDEIEEGLIEGFEAEEVE
jgi:intron-binding protein aquarius